MSSELVRVTAGEIVRGDVLSALNGELIVIVQNVTRLGEKSVSLLLTNGYSEWEKVVPVEALYWKQVENEA